MKQRNLVHDRMMRITLLYQIENIIEVDIWKNQIMGQVVKQFGSLKVDNDGDTGNEF